MKEESLKAEGRMQNKRLWLRAREAMGRLGFDAGQKGQFLKMVDAMNVRTFYKSSAMRGRRRPWQWYHAHDIERISRQ